MGKVQRWQLTIQERVPTVKVTKQVEKKDCVHVRFIHDCMHQNSEQKHMKSAKKLTLTQRLKILNQVLSYILIMIKQYKTIYTQCHAANNKEGEGETARALQGQRPNIVRLTIYYLKMLCILQRVAIE